MITYPILAGRIDSLLEIDQLAACLTKQGLRVEVRESCHYMAGRYIRICEGATDFTLERDNGEFIAQADANSLDQMHIAASRVSSALAAMDIRHAFEIYDEANEMVHYMHHRWPQVID